MSTQEKKPYRSASQVDLFCKCPEAFRRAYLEKDKIPPGIALAKGKGFHSAAEANMRQKIESHVDLPAKQVGDLAVAALETEIAGGVMIDEGNASAVIDEAKYEVANLAYQHVKTQAPEYQPVHVEQTVRIELPGSSHDLLGVIDLADDRDRVVDFKTAGKKKAQSDADVNTGLTVYAAAFHVLENRLPSELRLDTIVTTKTKVERQVLTTDRGPDDFSAFAWRLNVMNAAVAAGSFSPASPMAWWCAPKWCGYYNSCPFVNPRRRLGAQGD